MNYYYYRRLTRSKKLSSGLYQEYFPCFIGSKNGY
jgi:hypothetical protein